MFALLDAKARAWNQLAAVDMNEYQLAIAVHQLASKRNRIAPTWLPVDSHQRLAEHRLSPCLIEASFPGTGRWFIRERPQSMAGLTSEDRVFHAMTGWVNTDALEIAQT
jgi:hypothetical protein